MSEVKPIKEKLLADIITNNIQVDEEIIIKAMNNDGYSLIKTIASYQKMNDYSTASNQYRLSAAQNYPDTQCELKLIYRVTQSISLDYNLSKEWYLKAYNNGILNTINKIISLREKGNSVIQGQTATFILYLDAANKGNYNAQTNSAIHYENDLGAVKNKYRTLDWYNKCAKNEFSHAKKATQRLNGEGFHIDANHERLSQVDIDKDIMEKKIKLLEEGKVASNKEEENLRTRIQLLEQEIKVLELTKKYSPKMCLIEFSIKVGDGPDTKMLYNKSGEIETIQYVRPENENLT